MATVQEIITRIEIKNAEQLAVIAANDKLIIDSNRVAWDCLAGRLNELAKIVSCPDIADIVYAVDRSAAIEQPPSGSPGDGVSVENWLTAAITEIPITESGVHGSIYTSPNDATNGASLGNTTENHGLSGSSIALEIAAGTYTVEAAPGLGQRPYDQLINAASTQLLANGRVGSRKIIVLLMTGRSNFIDGYGTVATDPIVAANNARAAGFEIYVVGVSPPVDPGEAAAIAGGVERAFLVPDFNSIIYTVDSLKSKICVDSSAFVTCLPSDPQLTEVPPMNICSQANNCCNELL